MTIRVNVSLRVRVRILVTTYNSEMSRVKETLHFETQVMLK